MKNATCQKYIRRQSVNETCSIEGTYNTTYKHCSHAPGLKQADRPAGIGFLIRTGQLDSSLVVPFNAKQTRILTCDLNRKSCISRVGGIKDLFKYVSKGHDQVTVYSICEAEN